MVNTEMGQVFICGKKCIMFNQVDNLAILGQREKSASFLND